MKNPIFLFAGIILLFISCSKPSGTNPYQSEIIGTWKAVQIANDNNNNQKMDATELRTFTPKEGLYYTFNSDKTGIRNSSDTGATLTYDTTYTFIYSFAGNYVDMRFNASDDIKMYIEKIDNTTGMMTLRSEDNIWSWGVFQKQ